MRIKLEKVSCKSLFLFFISISVITSNVNASQSPRIWVSAEYLYWWSQDSPISVPLATTNTLGMIASIDNPGTQVLIGSGSNKSSFNYGGMSGARLTIGGWLDDCHQYGLEASGFGFPQQSKTLSASSLDGSLSNLDVPFYSTQTATETVLVGGRKNTVTDTAKLTPSSLEINGLYHLSIMQNVPVILSAGLRYMDIKEKLSLNDAVVGTPSLPVNSTLNVHDDFATTNHFYGLQIGVRSNYLYNKFNFEGLAQIGLGRNYQKLSIKGQTNLDSQVVLQPIGLFAEPTNIGTFKTNYFSIVPELRFKIGYNFNSFIKPFITYSFIYINNILRPGEEIDRNINKTQNIFLGGTGTLSGAASPVPKFHQTSMWLQGLSVGLEFEC